MPKTWHFLMALGLCVGVAAHANGAAPAELSLGFGQVSSVVFTADGRYLVAGGESGVVVAVETVDWHVARIFSHGGWINALASSHDSWHVAVCTQGGDVAIWDIVAGSCAKTIRTDKIYVTALALSPNGKYLALNGPDVWSIATSRRVWHDSPFPGTAAARSAAFSPDGSLLAEGYSGYQRVRTIVLWDTVTREPVGALEWETPPGAFDVPIAFSPDGVSLASGTCDSLVRLWDVPTKSLRHVCSGHSGAIYSVAYSPNGTLIASGSDDGTVRLWDAATGELARVFEGHTATVYSIAFSPDGALLASGSADGTVRLWRVG
jgi:WD40 repeat protein